MFEEFLTTIEFQLSLLLFIALAGYLIASKINQSAIVWEILLGIAIGPSLLGLIVYTESVQILAHIGAVVLLFVVGLEFELKDIFNVRYGIITPGSMKGGERPLKEAAICRDRLALIFQEPFIM